MGHFAKLDDNNVVLEVTSLANAVMNDLPFPQSEQLGIEFLTAWSNGHTNWKQTSYNKNFRVHYAGIGYTYDATRDAFIPPQPFQSWLLEENTLTWKPPVEMPEDIEGYIWVWNETNQNWQSIKGMEI